MTLCTYEKHHKHKNTSYSCHQCVHLEMNLKSKKFNINLSRRRDKDFKLSYDKETRKNNQRKES